jgi:hypothetical protein
MDNISIGVTPIIENVTLNSEINNQVIDITVSETVEVVNLDITPNLIEINILRGEAGGTILQFDTLANFPVTGSGDYFYLAKDTNKLYRWTGSAYVEISTTSSTVWGQITGSLSNQTDLQNALNLKAPIDSPTFTGTVSGITKAMVGLGSVDNTSDLDKPISTATQTALNAKQPLDGDLTAIAGLTGTAGFLKKNGANSYILDNSTYLSSITSSDVTTALGFTPENAANKGANNGYASLDGAGKVPSTQLPSYVDDVVEVNNFASLPVTGESGKIYITLDTNKIYRWTGSVYVEVSPSVGTVWGGITGTLSNQTDLQTALNAKQDDLNGTGFVKVSGTTVSYDNNTYLTSADLSGYVDTTTTQSIGGQKTFTGYGLFDNGIYIKKDGTLSGITGYNTIDANNTSIILSLTNASSAAEFKLSNLTELRFFDLPNASGTIALTSDIPSLSNYVTLSTAQTITGDKTFSGAVINDGDLYIKQDASYAPKTGYVNLFAGAGNILTYNFGNSNINQSLSFPSNGRVYSFPDATGTLALTSDIPSLAGYVPTSRTITINGTTFDLSADRTYTIPTNSGTVTSVALTVPSAFSVSGSPITSSGTLAITAAGDTTQYIAGDGSLVTFPTVGIAGTLIREIRNTTGATLTKGTVVYISGATGNKPTVSKALATGDSTSAQTFGLVQADIANNANGNVVCAGDITGLDTSAFTEGAQLYLSSTTAGTYTTTKQLAPNHLVYIGVITRAHPTQGQIEVNIQNGYELYELHDVSITSEANNQGLFYEASTDLWKNKSIATVLGYTPANDANVVHTTGAESISGVKTFTTAVHSNILKFSESAGFNQTAGFTQIGGTADYFTFANGGNTKNAQFNYNSGGNIYTLPASSGTLALTSQLHNAVTIGTANGLSLSTQVLSLGLASTSATGALSSTDWNTFNNKASTAALASYLPLAGGTLTGALSGTSATFSGVIRSDQTNGLALGSIAGYRRIQFDNSTTTFGFLNDSNALANIAVAGGTFSSSVTAVSTIVQGAGEDGSAGPVMRLTSTNSNAGARNWGIINTWDNFGDLTFRVSNAQGGNALSAGTSVMTLLRTGNVGIGTTAPNRRLSVFVSPSGAGDEGIDVNNGTTRFLFVRTGSSYTYRGVPSSAGMIYSETNISMLSDGGFISYHTSGGERMRITSAGNVGIGTTAPKSYSSLTVSGQIMGLQGMGIDIGQSYRLNNYYNSGTVTDRTISTGFAASIGLDNSNGGMTFSTSASSVTADNNVSVPERMRITSGGFVKASNNGTYLGATGNYHEVRSNLASDTLVLSNSNAGGSAYYSELVTSGTSQYHFSAYAGGAYRIFIYSNGNIVNTNGSYGTISDVKFKENIVDATPKLGDLAKLKVRNFNLKGDSTKHIGFIAQEFEEVFPNMVDVSTERGTDGETYKSIKTSVLIPMLVKSIQELKAELDTLKNK